MCIRDRSILTISDHIFTGEALSAQERQDSFHEMMEIALETAWNAACLLYTSRCV